MSRSWPLVPLREAASPVERPEVPLPGTVYRQVGVRLWGEGAYEREPMDGSQTKYATLSRVEGGDIVVNKIWARNGSVAVVPDALGGAYVSGEFPTFVPARQKLDPRWFHWFTKTPNCWDQCDEKSRGTSGKNRIRPEQFLEITIPLPSLGDQRRIVARIEVLAAKIEEARALRGHASQGADQFIPSLHLSLSGARSLRLDQFLQLYEDQEPVQAGRSYPQIGIKGFGQGLFARAPVEGSQTTYAAFNRLYDGAVVLSQVKGWEGAIAVCPSAFSGAYVSPEYRTFRCIPSQAIPEYLEGLFPTPWFWNKLSDLTRGVGARRERVRPELFLNMEIPMPPVNDQRRAVPTFERVRVLRRLQAETGAELDALLPSILDRAFKGEL